MRVKHLSSKGLGGLGWIIVIISILIFGSLIMTYVGLGFNWMDLLKAIYLQVGIWFILIGGGVFLIIFSMTMMQISSSRRFYTLSKIGMVMICLSLIVILVQVIVPLFMDKVLGYEECKSFFGGASSTFDEKDIYRTVSCVFVGYSPTAGATAVTYVNFIIVSIIAPFVFFYYIFSDTIQTMNFPSSQGAQRAIAFIGAYSALRGALATYFVEFFAYSWYGMGVLAFGIFMMMMAWALIRKYYEAVIVSDNMKKLFQVIAGDMIVSPRELIMLINANRLPYTFLERYGGDVEGVLNKLGYQALADSIHAKILEADTKFHKNERAKKDGWLHGELNKIVP